MGGEVEVAGTSVLGEYIKPYLSRGSSVIDDWSRGFGEFNVATVTGCCYDPVVVSLDGEERASQGDDRW